MWVITSCSLFTLYEYLSCYNEELNQTLVLQIKNLKVMRCSLDKLSNALFHLKIHLFCSTKQILQFWNRILKTKSVGTRTSKSPNIKILRNTKQLPLELVSPVYEFRLCIKVLHHFMRSFRVQITFDELQCVHLHVKTNLNW